MKKKIAFLLVFVIFLSSCELIQQEDNTPKLISQFAASAIASDSYGGNGQNKDDQSPFSATGKPEIKNCDDSKYAWTTSKEDDGVHWLELNYDVPVYVNKIRVYENFNPGSIVKIELKKFDSNDYELFWEGTYKTKQCPFVFEKEYYFIEGNITKNITSFKSDAVKLTINTDIPGWNEIDAVELIGFEKKFSYLNGTLIIENE
ncbi:MAG: hypothetical protein QXM96_01355 [Candidatus Woesearchaeota archaeon]